MDLELTLSRPDIHQTQVAVTCNDQPSHIFDLRTMIPNKTNGLPHPIDDPIAYGTALYAALFPSDSPAWQAIDRRPERILLVATDPDLDAIPWEYTHGPDGFLVCDYPFVRGLPAGQRIPPPTFSSDLHIVAVPSNPLSAALAPLNIEGEWTRLKENIEALENAVTLERAWPPTIDRLRALVANQQQRVVHFMGHGGQDQQMGAVLCFERDDGAPELITAREFVKRVRGGVFLVTLNACESATPGENHFSNLAAALVREKIPYALGMRFSIYDDDARDFSAAFYNDLACGTPIEEALLQARLTLAKSARPWAIGIPVLYTSLHLAPGVSAPAFTAASGTPVVIDPRERRRDRIDVLPRIEGIFQGRVKEQLQLGAWLTGDNRPPIIIIHGGGGQGKTALACVAADHFAHAWPGGVWAITLENLPSRAIVVADLARFLGLDVQALPNAADLEREVARRLRQRRTLLLLDNAETLVEAVEAHDEAALRLAEWLRQVPGPLVSLLITSRVLLGWPGEVSCELGSLLSEEGALLFRQSAPQRSEEVDIRLARQLSEKVDGHPLSLRLLGEAFNASAIALSAFLNLYEEQLIKAENTYVGLDHRQRTLFACIETSVRYLDIGLRALLSGLWIFHAPFLPESAVAIFDPEAEESEENPSAARDRLYTLWQRGLLTREITLTQSGKLEFYYLLPAIRLYIEHNLEQTYEHEMLLERFGKVYARLVNVLHHDLDRSSAASEVIRRIGNDLERGVTYTTLAEQAAYRLRWGWILHRIGNPWRGLSWLEQALEDGQGQGENLEAHILPLIAQVYKEKGEPQRASKLYEQALAMSRQQGDKASEATALHGLATTYFATGEYEKSFILLQQALSIIRQTDDLPTEAAILSNLAATYQARGQQQQALSLYQQVVSLMRAVGDRAGEGAALNNIACIYRDRGQFQEALILYQHTLPITYEIGDPASTAVILNNIADIYRATDQIRLALEVGEQALFLMRRIGNRPGEAATLNNMALAYRLMGQPYQALPLYETALSIRREVGDRAGEVVTLSNIGEIYAAAGQPQQALVLCEKALLLTRQISDPAGEASVLYNTASLLYRYLNRTGEAIVAIERAIAILQDSGLSHDAAGDTVKDFQHTLHLIRTGTLR